MPGLVHRFGPTHWITSFSHFKVNKKFEMTLVHNTRYVLQIVPWIQNLIWACAFLLNILLHFRFPETVDLILTVDTHSLYVNTKSFPLNDWLSGTSCKHPWFGSRFEPTHWMQTLFWATTSLTLIFTMNFDHFKVDWKFQGQVSFECFSPLNSNILLFRIRTIYVFMALNICTWTWMRFWDVIKSGTSGLYVNTKSFPINDLLSGTSCKHPWFGSRFGPTHWIKKLFWATTKLKIEFQNGLRARKSSLVF